MTVEADSRRAAERLVDLWHAERTAGRSIAPGPQLRRGDNPCQLVIDELGRRLLGLELVLSIATRMAIEATGRPAGDVIAEIGVLLEAEAAIDGEGR